ncbi:DUF3710 domain-containing protein [Zhihengliuella salsuginis]|uniref:DUF3710 domain-containing protein n=1 Tax=Zhihengliuella salsuginis TaxID=578222 RepID=A0ABQ3GD67_9MICC|nr:DUF3710 domain-containing protein [Zhihengliuella salsuginis]GHD01195.1 hypothetical protein GCM10008096_05030 [Zhihengliuella salsuginis]
MIFKRKQRAADEAEEQTTHEAQTTETAQAAEAQQAVGPFDGDEHPDREGYLDLGSLLVEPVEGMQMRLEVEDKTKRVIAVALELDGSRLQLQVFAAPKSETLWPRIQEQIGASIDKQGGKTDKVSGRFGEELVARVPAKRPDGTDGFMVARFLGFDGPRWFLRGVVGGPAALDRSKAEALEERMARAIVVRGDSPMPPSELLPLKVPEGAVPRSDEDPKQQAGGAEPGLRAPERGPEITEIG